MEKYYLNKVYNMTMWLDCSLPESKTMCKLFKEQRQIKIVKGFLRLSNDTLLDIQIIQKRKLFLFSP